MKAPPLRLLATAVLVAFLGGACREPDAPNDAASMEVAPVMVGPTLDNLQVSWNSPHPRWFTGSLFAASNDPYHAADSSVTTGSVLGVSYLAFVASTFDLAASIPVEVRFGASQNAYRLRRTTSAPSGYQIQSAGAFVPVPFTVWDVSTAGNPRQLTVAWRDNNNSSTWDPTTGLNLEVVFIYNKTYDPTGTQQFSMPPDAIVNQTTIGANADIIYGLSLQVLGGHGLSESTGTLTIVPAFFLNIDIKPESADNAVNCLNSKSLIPVAILTTPELDARQVDPATAGFGPARAPEVHGASHVEDVDADGDLDRVFHFRIDQTGLKCDDTEATLFARLNTGTAVRGTDRIRFLTPGIGALPVTFSTSTPLFAQEVIVTADDGFAFSAGATVNLGGVTLPVVSRAADGTSITIRNLPGGPRKGPLTVTSAIAPRASSTPLVLLTDDSLTLGPMVLAAPGATLIVPDTGVFESTTFGNPSRLYTTTLGTAQVIQATVTWAGAFDLGLYILDASGAIVAYADDYGATGGGGGNGQPERSGPVALPAGTYTFAMLQFGGAPTGYTMSILTQAAPDPDPDSRSRILIDASRDGGGWWAPQAGPFDPSAPHQGKALADYLRGRGYTVDELPRGATITPRLLNSYFMVLRAGYFGPPAYTAAELAEYQAFLTRGGALWLVSDHDATGDALAAILGINMAGSYYGTATTFAIHPITQGVTSHSYIAGGALSGAVPSDITVLGWFDTLRTLPIMGTKALSAGRVFFLGDINGLEQVPQPLVSNLLAWAVSP